MEIPMQGALQQDQLGNSSEKKSRMRFYRWLPRYIHKKNIHKDRDVPLLDIFCHGIVPRHIRPPQTLTLVCIYLTTTLGFLTQGTPLGLCQMTNGVVSRSPEWWLPSNPTILSWHLCPSINFSILIFLFFPFSLLLLYLPLGTGYQGSCVPPEQKSGTALSTLLDETLVFPQGDDAWISWLPCIPTMAWQPRAREERMGQLL